MECQRCGSTQFEEENGLYFCTYCQTQSQGFTQEVQQQVFFESRPMTKEVKEKRKPKQKTIEKRNKGILWTTSEAFNYILFKQMLNILRFQDIGVDKQCFKNLLPLVWFSYLKSSDIAFRDNETDEECGPRLHPASRFRDQQILRNKVKECLPKYRNGSTELGFIQLRRFGTDAIVRRDKRDSIDCLNYVKSEVEKEFDMNDMYYDKYNDPRVYAKRLSNHPIISKESRRQLKKLLNEMDLQTSFENTIQIMGGLTDDQNMGEIVGKREDICKNFKSAPYIYSDSEDSDSDDDTVIESVDSEVEEIVEDFDDYDRELIKSLTQTSKIYSKYIPLSYMKNTRNISTNYFIDLMTLPKTLAMLNIVNRLLNNNIYVFDLIRWASEGHIPYLNCLTCFPDDWVILVNDFHTFTSQCVPSARTIHILTIKIAKHIKITTFPRPDLTVLLERFAKDLNLPKGIVNIIDNDYNLYTHFHYKLELIKRSHRSRECMPSYEMWALMSIVIVLKRIFVLDDKTEICLSEFTNNWKNLFVWEEWEKYTRLRLDLIKSYYIPLYGRNFEDVRDVDLLKEHILKRTEYEKEKTIFTDKKRIFDEFGSRVDIQSDFQQCLGVDEHVGTQLPSASLYPLTNATNFALTRIDSTCISSHLSVNFEDKDISPWICSHGNAFHRHYNPLDIESSLRNNDLRNWSSSFNLLIELSAIMLNCRYRDLFSILNEMEKTFFGDKVIKRVRK